MTEELNLKIYDFLLSSFRKDDEKNGYPLKNFLQGMQEVWETINDQAFEVKNLWDLVNIEDEYLKYLAPIVGWTGKLKDITDALDYDTLRRLIGTSIALWKDRSTEDSLTGVLQLITKARCRILTWFDLRWIVGETTIEEIREETDSWLIDSPSESSTTINENYSNLRIVDDGTLDKDLVVNLVKLMRPANERIEVVYLRFIDLFATEDDNSQWESFTNPFLEYSGTWIYKNETINGEVYEVVENVTDGTAYIETSLLGITASQAAYGTFKWLFYKNSDTAYIKMNFIDSSYSTAGLQYQFEFRDNEAVRLVRSAVESLFETATAYINNQQWYECKVVRLETVTPGQFTSYLDDVLIDLTGGSGSNPVVDNDHTTSDYISIQFQTGDKLAYKKSNTSLIRENVELDGELKVANNYATLDISTNFQSAFVSISGASSFSDYVAYFKIKLSTTTGGGGCGFYIDSNGKNGYLVNIDIQNNYIRLYDFVNGVIDSTLASYDYSAIGILTNNIYYGLKIHVSTEGSTNRIIIYLDSEELINTTDNTYSQGTIMLWHGIGATIIVDEVELLKMPVDSDFIDINS